MHNNSVLLCSECSKGWFAKNQVNNELLNRVLNMCSNRSVEFKLDFASDARNLRETQWAISLKGDRRAYRLLERFERFEKGRLKRIFQRAHLAQTDRGERCWAGSHQLVAEFRRYACQHDQRQKPPLGQSQMFPHIEWHYKFTQRLTVNY